MIKTFNSIELYLQWLDLMYKHNLLMVHVTCEPVESNITINQSQVGQCSKLSFVERESIGFVSICFYIWQDF